MEKNYYKILGVEKNATQEEIKKAYRDLAKKHHPDINGDEKLEEEFKEINEAYQTLKNKEKRKTYDLNLENPRSANGFRYSPFDFDMDNFTHINFFSNQNKPKIISVDIKLSIKEAIFGVDKKTISYNCDIVCDQCNGNGCDGDESENTQTCPYCVGTGFRAINPYIRQLCNQCSGSGKTILNKCKKCNGSGIVRKERKIEIGIPPGVLNNNVIGVKGAGNYNKQKKSNDEIRVVINIEEDKYMHSYQNNIRLLLPIKINEAVYGCEKIIPSPHGTLKVKINKKTSHGNVYRIKGKGMRNSVNSESFGDLEIFILIDIPELIDENIKEMIEENLKYEELEKFDEHMKKWKEQ
jgi:molecular chaperone DnaJ